MTKDDRRYVWRAAILAAFGICTIICLFAYKGSNHYTDKAIEQNNKELIPVIDSVVEKQLNDKIMPSLKIFDTKLDTLLVRTKR